MNENLMYVLNCTSNILTFNVLKKCLHFLQNLFLLSHQMPQNVCKYEIETSLILPGGLLEISLNNLCFIWNEFSTVWHNRLFNWEDANLFHS
jgi:hypothetical protein